MKGVEYEQSRKFYEATQFYKRAVQLVPDIEFRLYDSTKLKSNDESLEDLDNGVNNIDDNSENHNDKSEEESDLFIKLCKIINLNKCVCFPKFEQNVSVYCLKLKNNFINCVKAHLNATLLLSNIIVTIAIHFLFQTTHISALPIEIVLYILRWVVSSELDLRSLEMFSRVCRGFYISARDSEIWRLVCVR